MKLSAAARKRIPTSEFAGPDRSYPIADESHARNALARASGKPVEWACRLILAIHTLSLSDGDGRITEERR